MFNIKYKLIGAGCGLLSFGILACVLLFPFVLIWGVAKVLEFLFPIFYVLTSISIASFIIVVLPFSLIHKFRPFLARTSLRLSVICGATVWMYSFLVIFNAFGWFAIFLFFFFHSVAPIAAVILFLKSRWLNGAVVIIGLLCVYGMRIYSHWLTSLYGKRNNYSLKYAKKDLNDDIEEGEII